jgi:hypothetical protein
MAKISPFDIINDISYGKAGILNEDNEHEYNAFLTNKALSYHLDSVLLANEMNMVSQVGKRLQYEYYMNSLRKRKRYSKWIKSKESKELDAIAAYYNYNNFRAREALSVLTPLQIKNIVGYVNDCS